MSESKPPVRKKQLLKIIMVGDSSTGKTSLMQRFVQGKYTNQYKATIGADFLSKDVFGGRATAQIWDTAGQERFQSLGVAFYRGANAVILCYDTMRVETAEKLQSWYDEFMIQAGGGEKPPPAFIVGTKYEPDDDVGVGGRDAAIKQATSVQAKIPNSTHIQTSAKNDLNVSKAFESLIRQVACKPMVLAGSADYMDKLTAATSNCFADITEDPERLSHPDATLRWCLDSKHAPFDIGGEPYTVTLPAHVKVCLAVCGTKDVSVIAAVAYALREYYLKKGNRCVVMKYETPGSEAEVKEITERAEGYWEGEGERHIVEIAKNTRYRAPDAVVVVGVETATKRVFPEAARLSIRLHNDSAKPVLYVHGSPWTEGEGDMDSTQYDITWGGVKRISNQLPCLLYTDGKAETVSVKYKGPWLCSFTDNRRSCNAGSLRLSPHAVSVGRPGEVSPPEPHKSWEAWATVNGETLPGREHFPDVDPGLFAVNMAEVFKLGAGSSVVVAGQRDADASWIAGEFLKSSNTHVLTSAVGDIQPIDTNGVLFIQRDANLSAFTQLASTFPSTIVCLAARREGDDIFHETLASSARKGIWMDFVFERPEGLRPALVKLCELMAEKKSGSGAESEDGTGGLFD